MPDLSLKKLTIAVSYIAICGLLLGTVPKTARAEDTGDIFCHTFVVMVDSSEATPDFLSEQSLGLVVAPAAPMETDLIQFVTSNCNESFNSTIWERQDAMHITTDGIETPGSIYWLLTPETPEPPPLGAYTLSGSDSLLIIDQQTLYYETFGTGYRVRCSPGGAGKMVVVTAIFSR